MQYAITGDFFSRVLVRRLLLRSPRSNKLFNGSFRIRTPNNHVLTFNQNKANETSLLPPSNFDR